MASLMIWLSILSKSHLMGELVRDDDGDSLSVGRRRLLRIDQHGRLSVDDQPPVLHGSCRKFRSCKHIWKTQRRVLQGRNLRYVTSGETQYVLHSKSSDPSGCPLNISCPLWWKGYPQAAYNIGSDLGISPAKSGQGINRAKKRPEVWKQNVWTQKI